MDKDEPMNIKVFLTIAMIESLPTFAMPRQSQIMQFEGDSAGALAFISAVTNHWGVDATSAMDAFEGVYEVLRFPLADCEQSPVCDLFCIWMDEQIPLASDMNGTNSWLRVKCAGMRALTGSRAVCNDTNCWMAAAREYRRISILDEAKWYRLLDLDDSLIDERVDGTVVICAPPEKRAVLEDRAWITIGTNGVTYVNAPAGAELEADGCAAARDYKAALTRCRNDVRHVLGVFASSDMLADLSPQSRNAMVSNIVETARLTQEEACALGWTNVAVSVSQ